MKDSYTINLMNDGKTNLGLEFIKAHYVRDGSEEELKNDEKINLGLEFIKAYYLRNGSEEDWEIYQPDEQHRIDAINKVAHLIGSITIIYTLISNTPSIYSISAIFHMNQSMYFGSEDNLFLDEKEQSRGKDWEDFIQSLVNDEQQNDLSYAGVDRTLIFYCESY